MDRRKYTWLHFQGDLTARNNSHQIRFSKLPKYLILIGAYLHLHKPKYYKKIPYFDHHQVHKETLKNM